jgi:hypothetical protein
MNSQAWIRLGTRVTLILILAVLLTFSLIGYRRMVQVRELQLQLQQLKAELEAVTRSSLEAASLAVDEAKRGQAAAQDAVNAQKAALQELTVASKEFNAAKAVWAERYKEEAALAERVLLCLGSSLGAPIGLGGSVVATPSAPANLDCRSLTKEQKAAATQPSVAEPQIKEIDNSLRELEREQLLFTADLKAAETELSNAIARVVEAEERLKLRQAERNNQPAPKP